jgi:hypothetical protein
MSDLTILIISYDKDRDILPIFSDCFLKHTTSSSIPSILVSSGSNFGIFPNFFTTNGDESFSSRIACGLQIVKTEYVLLLLHDYFVASDIEDSKLNEACSFLSNRQGDYMQVATLAEGRIRGKSCGDKRYRALPQGRHYRLSLQPAIWRTDLLRRAIKGARIDSTWDFEAFFIQTASGKEINTKSKCFLSKEPLIDVVNGLEKGVITYPALKLLRKSSISLPTNRPVDTKFAYFKRHLFDAIKLNCPEGIRRIFKKIGRMFGKKYLSEN